MNDMRRQFSSGSGARHEWSRGNGNVIPAVSDHRQANASVHPLCSSHQQRMWGKPEEGTMRRLKVQEGAFA